MEEEYICETNIDKDWQKKLNQWKHDYKIEILGFSNANACSVSILIKRTKIATTNLEKI